jgi:hypothetical protein
MAKPTLTSLLKICGAQDSTEKKVEMLRSHRENKGFMELLMYTYNPRIHFLLPQAKPPYTPCKFLDQDEKLYSEVFKLVNFCELHVPLPNGQKRIVQGGPATRNPTTGEVTPSMTQLKREQLFIRMLESVHPEDAVTLCNVKNKTLDIKGLTERVIRLAFPGWLPEEAEFFKKNKLIMGDETKKALGIPIGDEGNNESA